MPAGGARQGAGRPTRKPKADPTATAEALGRLLELAAGQSSVQLELDSKQQVKSTVDAHHRNVHTAGTLAQAEFDRLMAVYYPKPAPTPVSTAAFSDDDLELLGLQRIPAARSSLPEPT